MGQQIDRPSKGLRHCPKVLVSYVMLGRIADAHLVQTRLREVGLTLSQIRKYMPYQRQEDAELYFEAFRIAGVPE